MSAAQHSCQLILTSSYVAYSPSSALIPPAALLTQLVWRLLNIEDTPKLIVCSPDSLIFQHSSVDSSVFSLDLQHCLWLHGLQDVVIIAMRAVFIGVLELVGVLAEALLAFLAGEGPLVGLKERMVFGLAMAVGAVEPFAACNRVRG